MNENANSITYKNVLEKLMQKSDFIKDLGFKPKEGDITQNDALFALYYDEHLLNVIAKTIETVYSLDIKKAKNALSDLLSRTAKGSINELIAYNWLLINNIQFEPQINSPDAKNTLDGCFNVRNNKVYFDIKTFDVPYSCLKKLHSQLASRFPDCFVEVLAGNMSSYEQIGSVLSSSVYEKIVNELEKSFDNEDHHSRFKNDYFQIRLHKKSFYNGSFFYGSKNPYTWAQNNEGFFQDDSKQKQFTKSAPFMLICIYEENFTFQDVSIPLRSIARRTFIKFRKSSELLSAILFINISSQKAHLYQNPNAKNKINWLCLHKIFVQPTGKCPFIFDDFEFDNY